MIGVIKRAANPKNKTWDGCRNGLPQIIQLGSITQNLSDVSLVIDINARPVIIKTAQMRTPPLSTHDRAFSIR